MGIFNRNTIPRRTERAANARREHTRRKRLFMETLEARQVMDGAAALSGLPESEANESQPEPTPALIRFETADELQQHLVERGIQQWRHLFGTTHEQYFNLRPTNIFRDPTVVTNTYHTVAAAQGSVALNYSQTNVQVSGVDEGDLVKTDGEYLYIARDKQITIIDVRDPNDLQLVGRLDLDFPAQEIYVSGDRLTVVAPEYAYPVWTDVVLYYGIYPAYQNPDVHVSVYDISDRSDPELLTTMELDGSLVDSRLVNEQLVLVTQDDVTPPLPAMACVEVQQPINDVAWGADMRAAHPIDWLPNQKCTYESEEEYSARIADTLLENLLPRITVDGQIESEFLTAPADIVSTQGLSTALITTTIISIGGEKPSVADSAGVLSPGGSTVYANGSSVYVATQTWRDQNDATDLVKFSISDDGQSVAVTSSGSASGRLINQFAMDEWNGDLRLATTTGWGESATNSVIILREDGDELEVVGEVTGITPGERLRSARFIGDRGYLVTFPDAAVQFMDPLVVVDLSEPTDPEVLGELEIPGFSNYLHPAFGGYLIGLGQDANQETGIATNPQISLFDVRDGNNPTILGRESLSDRLNGAHAFNDHHAIIYLEEFGLFGAPFGQTFGPVGRVYYPDGPPPTPPSGLWLFKIDPQADDPVVHVGTIAHGNLVERGLRIGNSIITVSQYTVMAHDLTSLAKQDELYIGRITADDYPSADVANEETKLDVLVNDFLASDAVIISVTAPANGGSVRISDDGKYVFYTAPNAYSSVHEQDSFQYTVRNSDGTTETANVSVKWMFERDATRMADLAVRDLAARLEIAPERIKIIETTRVTWSDGSLGVPEPGMAYTYATVPGFRIWLLADGHGYEYHTNLDSIVKLVGGNAREGAIPDHYQVSPNSGPTRLDVLENDFPGIAFIRAPSITAVGTPSHGGTVTIGDDLGSHVLYTPAPNFQGIETFTYTVEGGSTARVTMTVGDLTDGDAGGLLIDVRIEIVDGDGNPVSQLEVGDEFSVNIYVKDLRETPDGVFSSYLDVLFNTQLADLLSIEHSPDYNNGRSGASDSSGVDELGGFAGSLAPLGAAERLLASVKLEAVGIGNLKFTSNQADAVPIHNSALYGSDYGVAPHRIRFGEAQVEIVNGFHNAAAPTDSNGDGVTSPIDALPIINWINEHGAGSIKSLLHTERMAIANGEGAPRGSRQFDTNGDGFCTHMDVLLVFNRVNQEKNALKTAHAEAAFHGPLPLDQYFARSNLSGAEGEASVAELVDADDLLAAWSFGSSEEPVDDTASSELATSQAADEFFEQLFSS